MFDPWAFKWKSLPTAPASRRIWPISFSSHRVRVVLKMNTFDEALQDRLAGIPGAFGIIRRALSCLQGAGYPGPEAFLAASTIICRQNIDELPELWRWLRDRGIEPYFEIMTPQSRAVDNTWLHVAPGDLKQLFKRIAEIDRTRYGRDWQPQPPLVGNRCLRHQFSCLVTSRGEVMPCVGIPLSQGNIRQRPLAQILGESQVIRDLKRLSPHHQGGVPDLRKGGTLLRVPRRGLPADRRLPGLGSPLLEPSLTDSRRVRNGGPGNPFAMAAHFHFPRFNRRDSKAFRHNTA